MTKLPDNILCIEVSLQLPAYGQHRHFHELRITVQSLPARQIRQHGSIYWYELTTLGPSKAFTR
jgi:hypothetical protein